MSRESALEGVIESVRPLIEAGAALHWLVPFEKRPIADEWASAAVQSEADLRKSYRTDANIGVRLGEPSRIDGAYLHLIDLDIRDADLADEAWNELLQRWPGARSFPTVISGSGGASRHIYFLTDKPFSKRKLAKSADFTLVWDERKQRDVRKFDWEIDVYGTGAQAVIPPSIHPDTRLPYRWEREIDPDFPLLMTVDSRMVESWGVSTSTASTIDDDEDDLFTLMRHSPMDLTPDEVDGVIADLPADWVDDRDQWLTVGAALHHQFEGTNSGFERWNEWAKQSPKFDARDSARVWKSFKGSKNPVRMATLIQAANANRLSLDLDLGDDGFDLPAVIPAPAAAAGDFDLTDLLGDTPSPTSTEAENRDEIDPNWVQKLHRGEEGDLKATLPNIALIVDNDPRFRGIVSFNEFTQEIVLRGTSRRAKKKRESAHDPANLDGKLWDVKDWLNGDNWTDSHDIAIRSIIESKTQMKGYGIKVSDRDLRGGVDISAQKRSFHPVRELLESAIWDSRPRAETMFIDYLGADDTPYHRQAALMTLVGAVARIYRPGHKFDFVPILEGVQGKGKSTFIRVLGLHWMNELAGDIGDPKQMVEVMLGTWVLEIGELSSMHRAEVNDLKAFVSRTHDKVRLAWEKRAREFPRQCIFIGSTNDREYLKDQTGGRRFWPIVCKIDGEIDNALFEQNVMQIWAEAVHIYKRMRAEHKGRELPLYLTEEAALQAVAMQESRRVETVEEIMAGKIGAWLDQPIGTDSGFDDLDADAPKLYRQVTCVAQIWEEMMGRDGTIPHTESTKIGKALTVAGWPRSAGIVSSYDVNKKYGKCRVYFRPGTQIHEQD